MSRILFSLLLSGMVISGCSNSTSETTNADTQVPAMPEQTSADSATFQPASISDPQAQMQPQTQTPMPGQPSTTTPATTAAGMNPAHGEPGHRCDIAVGAPLNSPPGKDPSTQINNITTTPPTAVPVTSPTAAPGTTMPMTFSDPAPTAAPATQPATGTPTTTAPGMNPPHGQPGHDCSIAVGAPLKK